VQPHVEVPAAPTQAIQDAIIGGEPAPVQEG
jgi:hypothetical protein